MRKEPGMHEPQDGLGGKEDRESLHGVSPSRKIRGIASIPKDLEDPRPESKWEFIRDGKRHLALSFRERDQSANGDESAVAFPGPIRSFELSDGRLERVGGGLEAELVAQPTGPESPRRQPGEFDLAWIRELRLRAPFLGDLMRAGELVGERSELILARLNPHRAQGRQYLRGFDIIEAIDEPAEPLASMLLRFRSQSLDVFALSLKSPTDQGTPNLPFSNMCFHRASPALTRRVRASSGKPPAGSRQIASIGAFCYTFEHEKLCG